MRFEGKSAALSYQISLSGRFFRTGGLFPYGKGEIFFRKDFH